MAKAAKAPTAEVLNPYEIAMQQFDTAADKLKLEEGLRKKLRSTRRRFAEAQISITFYRKPTAVIVVWERSSRRRVACWRAGSTLHR